MKLLYQEDEYLEVVTGTKKELTDFINMTKLRHKLNCHRNIEIFKPNFENKNFSAETIKTLFEKSDKKQKNQMFSKIY